MAVKGEAPEVTEAGYVATTDGPTEDTGSYYKATPAPGVRQDWREPPASFGSGRHEPERLSRTNLGSGNSDATSIPAVDKGFPWLWIAAGIGVLGFFGLLTTILVVYALWTGGGSATPDQPPDETWEGLKVKKGLR